MSASITTQDGAIRSSVATGPEREGRIFGGLMLAAFALYRTGAAIAPAPLGLVLPPQQPGEAFRSGRRRAST